MKCRVTYVTGQAPNIPWWQCLRMTDEEIRRYNEGFFRYETVEFEWDDVLPEKRDDY